MDDKGFGKKIISATKWSTITQIVAKIIVPITNMILARILAPEAFGVITTITMIISFVDMFTDAGFQKYLIQHEFNNIKEKYRNANVAFWTNLTISLLLWGIIILFSGEIAIMVGNPGLGVVIIVACAQLPLTSFSSIQMALFRREFDFKTLFLVRILSILIPIFITIPLAMIGFSYWSLIIGSIFTQLFNAIVLTLKSKWKPKLFYNIRLLKDMLSFSIWSLVEAISIWLTAWIDAFIIGYYLNEFYLGLYKTSTTMVNSLLALITASTVPVIFSALSRLQHDTVKFEKVFFKFQRLISIFVFPLGGGIFLFSDLATQVMLGDKWSRASDIVGIWGLTSAIMIVLGHYCSEVYRAKGRPKISFFAQILHLIVLVPTCIIAASFGFWTLVFARSLIRMQFVLVHLVIMKVMMNISVLETFKNIFPSFISTVLMMGIGYLLRQISDNIIWSLFSICICGVFYLVILLTFNKTKIELIGITNKLTPKKFFKSS
ncbi:lipopolysaccharide biosynthesis protein [Priestia megaterium]|uniref:lipopolysaccharide biosynthesis protein n=1 Tax=Priestia megaterium TaxID=1404 RepID=UPI003F7EABCA